ncbi:MAG: 4Fe-4S dicluster domain-containing protein, partial [Intestinibacter sp.]|uniref:4Fe-4S binding protein n=1 Tax=Intestinibacter sp. TaxID=1965304 RepID=UPI002A827380
KLFVKLGQNTGISKNTNKKLTILDKDKCIKCKKCAKVCPMQLQPYLEFNEQNQFDNENCIKCNTCVNNCPKKILTIKSLKGER